ncbi:hypothetical protein PC116_g21746 [Phytophthora cactorum]|uniref:Uncharacterized protein n=1 Tax=Phytophthora cactorum TaxID=29920 RepID=A0A8T1B895_9STRA|nr:hypothetical protein PC112_g19048 [Phytophthora cactorum]KAG2804815.1 hypothetical protein PC111_g18093 [Phytophthora cactorum]KAG2886356.1 hypothetical protein PC114_g19288 [Phytophthora cactorum]KAG2897464.1 hypothetical protein PC115_g17165 [Phytophthora cactorum]KAG2967446.1 hypothetical protein PC118_g18573 [Phytophthora cactorum]
MADRVSSSSSEVHCPGVAIVISNPHPEGTNVVAHPVSTTTEFSD